MKQFIVKILGVSVVMTLIGWLVFSRFLPHYYLPVFPYTLIFFLIFTILVHALQLRVAKKDFGSFMRTNMLATMIKLIIYSVFAVVYIVNDRENALTFVICLVIIYTVFSFIEVTELSNLSRKK